MPPTPRAKAGRTAITVFAGAIALAFKLAFAVIALALPLGAVWIASSLAAHRGGSIGIAVACGLAVWPGLPLLWEGVATLLARRNPSPKPAMLTRYDRLILRSVAVGIVANAVLLLGFPSTVFTALASRGDWMLAEHRGPVADRVRDGLRVATGGLEWLHETTHRNDYEDIVDERATRTNSEVAPSDASLDDAVGELVERHADASTTGFQPRRDAWPFVAELHPAVVDMPPEAERSLESVGRHLAAVEPDPTGRVKAIHDYVASRIDYDVPSYLANDIPDQSAEVVFTKRVGVCAGYAQLAAEIGTAAGLEIIVVVGDARSPGEDLSGEGHAWNAARIGDRWVLFDATWDAGGVSGDAFSRHYRTDYLMAPPEVFANTHFPEDPKWQLLAVPKTRAVFVADPAMAPGFYARGLVLRSPASGRARVGSSIAIELENPLGLELNADIANAGAARNFGWCEGRDTTMRCEFDRAARYDVRLWDGSTHLGTIVVDAAP